MKNAEKIIKVKKHRGYVESVMLEDGEVVPINHAILMAKEHQIEGVTVIRGKDGGEYIITDVENGIYSKDLNNLPVFR